MSRERDYTRISVAWTMSMTLGVGEKLNGLSRVKEGCTYEVDSYKGKLTITLITFDKLRKGRQCLNGGK